MRSANDTLKTMNAVYWASRSSLCPLEGVLEVTCRTLRYIRNVPSLLLAWTAEADFLVAMLSEDLDRESRSLGLKRLSWFY